MESKEEYRIIIFISHRYISFEYYQRDGAGKTVAIPYGSCRWPEPLAFYCTDTELMLGRGAASAVNNGAPNAFRGYFEHLPNNLYYERGGMEKPFGKILLEGAEEVFASFFRDQLLNNRGNVESNRRTMPLMIVCEEDILHNERAYLSSLFRDAGYGRVKVVSYREFIERYARQTIARNYDCDFVLEVWTEGGDLTLALIDLKGGRESRSEVFEGLGRDPRLEIIKEKIWRDISGFNGFLRREDEEDAIEQAAMEFLDGDEIMTDGHIVGSDKNTYNYWLNRHEIDFIKTDESTQLRRALSHFLTDAGIKDRSRILLALRGSTARNTYFENNLTNGFERILRTSEDLRAQVRQLIALEPIPEESAEGGEREERGERKSGKDIKTGKDRKDRKEEKDKKGHPAIPKPAPAPGPISTSTAGPISTSTPGPIPGPIEMPTIQPPGAIEMPKIEAPGAIEMPSIQAPKPIEMPKIKPVTTMNNQNNNIPPIPQPFGAPPPIPEDGPSSRRWATSPAPNAENPHNPQFSTSAPPIPQPFGAPPVPDSTPPIPQPFGAPPPPESIPPIPQPFGAPPIPEDGSSSRRWATSPAPNAENPHNPQSPTSAPPIPQPVEAPAETPVETPATPASEDDFFDTPALKKPAKKQPEDDFFNTPSKKKPSKPSKGASLDDFDF